MIKNKLVNDQIAALKNHDSPTVNTLRYILAQIKNKEIEKKSELSDEEVIGIIRKLKKELNESITAFQKGQRADLVREYEKQLQITSSYLPKEMSDEELTGQIQKIIAQNKDLFAKNPKALIGICMKELKSKVDASRILKTLNSL